jgi:hypothetical protein
MWTSSSTTTLQQIRNHKEARGMLAINIVPVVVVLIAPILFALKAKPLGFLPYRWATYWAIESAIVAVLVPFLVIPIIKARGLDAGVILFLLLIILCALAAIGLFYRMRAGAFLLITSEVYILLLPALVGALYNSPAPKTAGGTAPILILIIVNIFYFKKRWASMASGLWPKS